MNIHEYQAKEILKEFGAPVSNGFVIFNPQEINEQINKIKSDKLVVKSQIHAGGRGKAGGVKLVDRSQISSEVKKMFGKILVTHQTGPKGKKLKEFIYSKRMILKKNFICLVWLIEKVQNSIY